MEHTMDKLVARCEAIAKANHDEFRYRIELDVNSRTGHYTYNLAVEETGDGHTFVSGSSLVLQEAIEQAIDGIEEECKTWGYTEPKVKEKK